MIINNTKLENLLKSFLQKKLSFELDNKVFKTGKILLFTQKYFYISFIINTAKKKQEKLDIPIPFDYIINTEKNQICLDYRINILAHNNKEALSLLQNFINKNFIKNKFFNKILKIQIINE